MLVRLLGPPTGITVHIPNAHRCRSSPKVEDMVVVVRHGGKRESWEDQVALGASGSAVDRVQEEDGTYTANGEVITAETTVTAANGNVYRWILSPEGVPSSVMHVAAIQDVMLGDFGGDITLTQNEDMTWRAGDRAVMSGDEVMSNGRTYIVTQDA